MAAVALAGVLAACAATSGGSSGASTGSGRVLSVVAAENFWGSIAQQLGGSRVQVTSIIDNPDADPHDYEPTAADGRAIASADMVIINGVGYDPWATKMAAANPDPARLELTVGGLLGVPDGGNPHRWYSPDDVFRVVDEITADYTRIDPSAAAYFAEQRTAFLTTGVAAYRAIIAEIKATYAGTPVGASESIFALLAPALGLDLVTPPSFLKAVSEGTDPTAADKAVVDAQIADRRIKVYVYNAQNATPDVQAQIAAATAQGIPVSTITETMVPASATWQQWQTRQLTALRDALAKASG